MAVFRRVRVVEAGCILSRYNCGSKCGNDGDLLRPVTAHYRPIRLALMAVLQIAGLLVAGMLGFHGLLEVHAARFRDGRETHAGRYFRIINEVPTLLLIGIVILVIIKPF